MTKKKVEAVVQLEVLRPPCGEGENDCPDRQEFLRVLKCGQFTCEECRKAVPDGVYSITFERVLNATEIKTHPKERR